MTALVVIGAAATMVSALLTGALRHYARQTQRLDLPNARSSHQVPTPRGGGLAIVIVVAVTLVALAWSGGVDRRVALALAAALPVAAIGWMDDRREIPSLTRAVVQALCAAWALGWLFSGLPGDAGSHGVPGGAAGLGLGVLAIVWLTNLYNFMDGIDGLAGGQAAVTGAVMAFLLAWSGQTGLAIVAVAVAGSSLGFLVWNWSPASIFLGDVGSGFLGFIFAILAAAGARERAVPLLAWIPLFALFLVDGTVTLLRRVARGDRWYAAHRNHAYQRAVQAGMRHATVSTVVTGAALLAGLAGAATVVGGRAETLPAVAGAALIAAAALYLAVERRRPMASEDRTGSGSSPTP